MSAVLAVHDHPIFFSVMRDGQLRDIIYHPEDDDKVLSGKKLLLSYLQVRRPLAVRRRMREASRLGRVSNVSAERRRLHGEEGKQAAGDKQAAGGDSEGEGEGIGWQMREIDCHGRGVSHYHARRGLFGRQAMRKLSWWHPQTGNRAPWATNATTFVIFDRDAETMRFLASDLQIRPLESAFDMEAMLRKKHKPEDIQLTKTTGFDMIPTEAVRAEWSLLPSPPPPPRRHNRRSLAARHDGVTRRSLLEAHGFEHEPRLDDSTGRPAGFTSKGRHVKHVRGRREMWSEADRIH